MHKLHYLIDRRIQNLPPIVHGGALLEPRLTVPGNALIELIGWTAPASYR